MTFLSATLLFSGMNRHTKLTRSIRHLQAAPSKSACPALSAWGSLQGIARHVRKRTRSQGRLRARPAAAASLKFDLRILNWFLIENMRFGRHVWWAPDACVFGSSLGDFPRKYQGTRNRGCGSSSPRDLNWFGGKMTVFSRAFVRKRVISLATTASVAAKPLALAQGSTASYHVRGAMPVQYVADRPDYYEESPFLSENDAAMNKMMANMTVKPTGDVDRDFVAMMVPHHQGAVDMAKAELKYGHNEQLRLPASVASPTRPATVSSPPSMSQDAMAMSGNAASHP